MKLGFSLPFDAQASFIKSPTVSDFRSKNDSKGKQLSFSKIFTTTGVINIMGGERKDNFALSEFFLSLQF